MAICLYLFIFLNMERCKNNWFSILIRNPFALLCALVSLWRKLAAKAQRHKGTRRDSLKATAQEDFRIYLNNDNIFMNKLFPFLICILILAGCKKDNLGQEVNAPCPTNNVTYSTTISGIINTNCLGCHGYGSPPS